MDKGILALRYVGYLSSWVIFFSVKVEVSEVMNYDRNTHTQNENKFLMLGFVCLGFFSHCPITLQQHMPTKQA